jgi:hypothetical protein
MPKKPPLHNPRHRAPRTVQSAATLLERILRRSATGISLKNQSLEKVRERFPESLREHVVDVLEKPEELVIFAASAAWAARLKLALAGQPALSPARRITVKLAPRGATAR